MDLRCALLSHSGHGLVIGGPGSGKTTLALEKAVTRILHGLEPGQSILFLSFSRAAVTRLAEAATESIGKEQAGQLSLQTFHSFFWDLIRGHAYLLGSPRRLSVLLPQDERAISGFKKPDPENPEYQAWLSERQRLFIEEGRVAFDLFTPTALRLLEQSAHLRRLISQRYPLIIVDEAQDTGPDAWRCMEILAPMTQIICLADIEQQIFSHLGGVGPDRIDAIRRALSPLEIDLGAQNHRSPGTEIALFGKDVLNGSPRGSPYIGVSSFKYPAKGQDWNKILRVALGILHKRVKKQVGGWPKTVAILATSGAMAARLSSALGSGPKQVRHRLHFDESEAMLSARFAAFLLEPKEPRARLLDSAVAVDLLADVKKAGGLAAASTMRGWAAKLRSGKSPKAELVKSVISVLEAFDGQQLSGDPGKDWLFIKRVLRESGQAELLGVARHLDYLVAFKRGERIAANLAVEWDREGQYTNARGALDSALTQDQLLDGLDGPQRLQIMTIHKSKGKQFDAVIVLRHAEFNSKGSPPGSSFVWRGDPSPFNKSRKICMVAVTRARMHTLILEPAFPSCPLLAGHRL